MPLTHEQIETLFQFTKKKLVHWYDLQAELVDHLASRIEEEQEANPALDFDRALKKVYDGFGIFGFAHIVQQKQEQLERSSRRLWWAAFRTFFRWPKIVLVAAALWAIWQATHLVDPLYALLLMLPLYVLSEFRLLRHRARLRRMTRPLLLLELSPLRFTLGFFLIQLTVSVNYSSPTSLFVFGVLGLLCVLVNMASFEAHRSVQADAEALYPEAFSTGRA